MSNPDPVKRGVVRSVPPNTGYQSSGVLAEPYDGISRQIMVILAQSGVASALARVEPGAPGAFSPAAKGTEVSVTANRGHLTIISFRPRTIYKVNYED